MLGSRLRRAVASVVTVAALVVSLLGAAAAPASAHSSSYCGHYRTGYWSNGLYLEVAYNSYSGGTGYSHTHHRLHYMNGYYWHSDSIQCPYNHPQ